MNEKKKASIRHMSELQAKEVRRRMTETIQKRDAQMHKSFELNRKRMKTR
ncbi:hypothetical protein BH11PAT1_BH11PAT1_5260 [soil metagenome]